jgi:hypothetical protein
MLDIDMELSDEPAEVPDDRLGLLGEELPAELAVEVELVPLPALPAEFKLEAKRDEVVPELPEPVDVWLALLAALFEDAKGCELAEEVAELLGLPADEPLEALD